MDLNKLRSFIYGKNVAIDIGDNVVRFNLEIGNDNAWREIEIDNRDEEQMAAIINTQVSKLRTGKVNKL